jgi:hypothetical protein
MRVVATVGAEIEGSTPRLLMSNRDKRHLRRSQEELLHYCHFSCVRQTIAWWSKWF